MICELIVLDILWSEMCSEWLFAGVVNLIFGINCNRVC